MRVRRHLLRRESDLLDSAILRERKPRPHVDRDAAPEIGQAERLNSVPSVGGSDQIEESVVVCDGEQPPIAESPPERCEVAGEHPDFTNKRLAHNILSATKCAAAPKSSGADSGLARVPGARGAFGLPG